MRVFLGWRGSVVYFRGSVSFCRALSEYRLVYSCGVGFGMLVVKAPRSVLNWVPVPAKTLNPKRQNPKP